MPLSDEDVAALRADLERLQREKETMQREHQQEKEAMQAKLEKEKRELGRSKWTKELLKREDEAELEWL